MVAFKLVCLLCLRQVASFTQPAMRTRSAATSLRSGATQQLGELKDYAGAAGGLFGTYRIPASLFAGASAGAAFAMPILAGEAATLGYVKRIYAALMISSLVCQLQVIVVSTVALERLSRAYDKEVSVESFMRRYFDLEWIAVRLNFFVGVLSFVRPVWNLNSRHGVGAILMSAQVTAIGLRAWQTIACPVVAKITLYTVISGSLTALAFVRSNEDCGGDLNDAFFRLPYLYARAMMKRARQNSMFAVAGLSVAFTWGYLLWSVPHIIAYMSH